MVCLSSKYGIWWYEKVPSWHLIVDSFLSMDVEYLFLFVFLCSSFQYFLSVAVQLWFWCFCGRRWAQILLFCHLGSNFHPLQLWAPKTAALTCGPLYSCVCVCVAAPMTYWIFWARSGNKVAAAPCPTATAVLEDLSISSAWLRVLNIHAVVLKV